METQRTAELNSQYRPALFSEQHWHIDVHGTYNAYCEMYIHHICNTSTAVALHHDATPWIFLSKPHMQCMQCPHERRYCALTESILVMCFPYTFIHCCVVVFSGHSMHSFTVPTAVYCLFCLEIVANTTIAGANKHTKRQTSLQFSHNNINPNCIWPMQYVCLWNAETQRHWQYWYSVLFR